MGTYMIDDLYTSMPWDALDAVVFDVGNVLLSYSPQEELDALFPGDTALHEKLMQKIIRSPYWNMMDRGTLTLEEAIEHMIGRDAHLAPQIRLFMEHWLDFKHPLKEGVEAARACVAHGKRVFVLSNYQREAFDRVEREYPFFALFEGRVVSAREGMIKPNADIYECLTQRYGLDPARTLFIDDTAANIEAALHLGWQGFCLNAPGKLSAFING